MSAVILDGKATATEVKEDLRRRVDALRARGIMPGLGTVLVGDDPGSHAYVGGKHRDCAEVGIHSFDYRRPANTTQEELNAIAHQLDTRPRAVLGFKMPIEVFAEHLDAVIESRHAVKH